MTEMKNITEKWTQLLKSGKLTYFLLAIGILFAVLIVFLPTDKKAVPETKIENEAEPDYEEILEEQLREMVSAITGEDAPHVTVTLCSSGETVYATEDRTSERNSQEYSESTLNKTLSDGDTEKTYIVLKDAEGAQKPLIVTQIRPDVKGVVIVSQYGNSAVVREKITHAVKTALNLSSTQVCVTGQSEYT